MTGVTVPHHVRPMTFDMIAGRAPPPGVAPCQHGVEEILTLPAEGFLLFTNVTRETTKKRTPNVLTAKPDANFATDSR